MKVLFLGDPQNPLVAWLREYGEDVVATKDKITPEWCQSQQFDFVVSYNYKHLVKPVILELYPDKIINLHISYLPYNRGMHPNIWSFVEDTPKGVTIHKMEAGLDTGDILVQKLVDFGDLEKQTLASTWNQLQIEIQSLFCEHWSKLRHGQITGRPQHHDQATFHYGRELQKLAPCFEPVGWQTPIHDFLQAVEVHNKIYPQTPPLD